MASITTRSGKGSPLTHAEVDANFTNLNTDKAETAAPTFTGQVKVAAGTAAAPGVAVTGDLNTGIYSPGADQVAISTDGTERLRIDATGQIEAVSLGTAAAPTYTFTGDPNSGLYSPGADQVAISTGGTGRLFIDANGNAGLGTASPTNFANYQTLAFNDTTGSFLDFKVNGIGTHGIVADSSQFLIKSISGLPVTFGTNDTERLRITSAGLVGIGTASPGTALDVVGTIRSSTTVSAASDFRLNNFSYSRVAHSNGVGGFVGGYNVKFSSGVKHDSTGSLSATYHSNDGTVRIYTSGSQAADAAAPERLIVTDTGRVGIGTSTPNAGLTISQNTAGAGTNGQLAFGDIGPGTPNARIDGYRTGGSYAGELHFYTTVSAGTVTRAVTIDASQRMGIGTTSPGSILHLSAVNPEFRFQGTNGTGGTHKFRATGLNDQSLQITSADDFYINASAHVFRSQNEATERARIDSSGRLLVGTASAVSSDGGTTFYAINQFSAGNVSNQGIFLENGVAGGGHGRVVFAKNRGGASGGTTIVLANDVLGANRFFGADGTGYKEAAVIAAVVDGTPGVDDMPGRLVFSTTADGAASPTERMRITSTGQVRLAGAGITFNGDTATANELDDYEEGTWTPNVGGNATYSTQVGTYTKIGRQVTVSFDIGITTLGTGDTNRISGLPFSVSSTGEGRGATGYFASLAINVISLQCYAANSSSFIYFNSMSASGATATQNPAIFGNSARVQGTVTYFV